MFVDIGNDWGHVAICTSQQQLWIVILNSVFNTAGVTANFNVVIDI